MSHTGGVVAERVRVREISNEEGNRLLRIVRRSSGSVVTWRRAQMVLLSAQGMDVPQIAKVAFTSEDRVRAVLHNFNDDGFDSLNPRSAGGRPPTFTLPQRQEIKKIALGRPVDHGLPFSTWSLAKLADYLVAEGVVDDISHEGLRVLLREEGVSFQAMKTWKESNDPDFEAKKNRILELYAIADGKRKPKRGYPTVVICVDEFGPLNLQPHPGKQWAAVSGKHADPERPPRRRRRATYKRPHGIRHLLAAYDLSTDRLYGHITPKKGRTEFPPDHEDRQPGRGLGQGQQRRTGLRPLLRQLAQPDRGPVHRPALLRPRRHRPRIPPGPGPHDPPLHPLAEPQRSRQDPS